MEETYEDLAGVAVTKSQSRVSDQMGQTVSAAEQVRLGIVREPLVGAVNGSVQGQVRCGASFVLHQSGSSRIDFRV